MCNYMAIYDSVRDEKGNIKEKEKEGNIKNYPKECEDSNRKYFDWKKDIKK